MSQSIGWIHSTQNGVTGASPSLGFPRYRNLPDPSIAPREVGSQGWQLTDLVLPTMTLRATALEHNARLHATWCESVGVSHAPHAKTHLSPEIVRLQLDSGAWGMTAASVYQAHFLAAVGAERVIIAHEVVDRANLQALVRLRAQYPDLAVATLVDSVTGVTAMEQHLREAGATQPLSVLLEIGVPEGRTGVRDESEEIAVANAVRDAELLILAGVEGFEGVLPSSRDPEHLERVDSYLARVSSAAARLDALGYFADVDEIVLTAGGSVYPDRVALMGHPTLSQPVRIVVRSGATITHDHGRVATHAPLAPQADNAHGALKPALELWAAVVSTPEPGLAVANFGKRDAPYDGRLPVVLDVLRNGVSVPSAGCSVVRVNDQHGYLDHADELRVGDILRLGPCHPCTAFDKWALIPVLADDDQVVGAVTTWF